jgi:hypothetical protein
LFVVHSMHSYSLAPFFFLCAFLIVPSLGPFFVCSKVKVASIFLFCAACSFLCFWFPHCASFDLHELLLHLLHRQIYTYILLSPPSRIRPIFSFFIFPHYSSFDPDELLTDRLTQTQFSPFCIRPFFFSLVFSSLL